MTMQNPRGDIPRQPRGAAPQLGLTGGQMPLEMVVAAIARMRELWYPWMHILKRADGTVVVTISQPPGGGQ
ncbi:hypothetical protein [Nocardia pseudovaccinii]|uniref:hypothetical protein n=1 Tax=Nocardia pseudovaccinii TaxID=189540 RepID=UPI0007A4D245|nr:hypothetical protein [Nocardia pseudovaccinii]